LLSLLITTIFYPLAAKGELFVNDPLLYQQWGWFRVAADKAYEANVKEKLGQGAELVIIEDEEVLGEFVDWSICLSVVRKSQKVFDKILEFYSNASKRRCEGNAKTIDDTLKKGEAALLVMTEENRMQIQSYLPSDIEVFLIHPPALNDFQRCFRDYWKNKINKTQD